MACSSPIVTQQWSETGSVILVDRTRIVRRLNPSSSTNQQVLRSLFPRPDVATVLHFAVFVDVDVQLQDGEAAARGKHGQRGSLARAHAEKNLGRGRFSKFSRSTKFASTKKKKGQIRVDQEKKVLFFLVYANLVERENFENRPRNKIFSACARLPR